MTSSYFGCTTTWFHSAGRRRRSRGTRWSCEYVSPAAAPRKTQCCPISRRKPNNPSTFHECNIKNKVFCLMNQYGRRSILSKKCTPNNSRVRQSTFTSAAPASGPLQSRAKAAPARATDRQPVLAAAVAAESGSGRRATPRRAPPPDACEAPECVAIFLAMSDWACGAAAAGSTSNILVVVFCLLFSFTRRSEGSAAPSSFAARAFLRRSPTEPRGPWHNILAALI